MGRLVGWIRSLGNAGAIDNAGWLREQRRAEDFALRALGRRVTAGRRAA
jgi:hypothetical protein